MKISFHTEKDNLDTTRGYGTAGFRMVTSLQELGHEVPFDDASAPVQISWNPPHWYKFNEGQYRIGYTPWESTELPDGWVRAMNDCDEVWATSEWVGNVYEMAGVKKPIHVYEHGLDKKWEPRRRKAGEVIKFLHMGEPALRKGGQMTVEAFREVFGDREDVHLTIKAYHQHFLRVWKDGKITTPDKAYNNVSVITDQMHFGELLDLYYEHDVLVYPSYGEGFGFIPLQALGTGMPVISTHKWAPYDRHLKEYCIGSRYDRSIWALHPGNVLYPNYDDLKATLRFISDREELEFAHNLYYHRAETVHREYDWVNKTEKAFAHIVTKFT
ncbi:glycosyltransferase [Streptomyces phage SparkleGoddess]|uniref:Glycosyltransferase n=1 Tax=Streptomyces phage SparkleGoddess TaxID=2283305 RepID=A0A345MDV4_9CAUD|nr:glycosyltransferase [Streptomyces phage SparkleGoddess]UTN92276.1 glycosyltransferase [Streptomyces phage Stigma]